MVIIYIMNSNIDTKIRKLYNDPEIGLIGVNAFHDKLAEYGIDIDLDELKRILSKEDSYTINKPAKTKFPTRKLIVYYVYEQLQADLVFMDGTGKSSQGAPAKENDDTKYLLTVIDVLSKFAWVAPLKDKTGKSIAEAFEPIISQTKPKLLQVDKGTEFYNKTFQDMLEKHGVKMFSTNSDKKAQVVERFNRTLKLRMGKLFDAQNSFRYVDKLEDLVNNYNNTVHSTIKMKPVDAIKPENYDKLMTNYYASGTSSTGPNKTKIKFEVGDIVKIPIYLSTFTKEMTGKWTRELFKVPKVNDTVPVTYNLIDLNNEPIEGTFYAEELQKIDKSVLDEPFKIEKVIKKSKGKSLVKYLGYPDSFNQWIDSKYIHAVPKRVFV
jgi:hypothetical protein